MGGYGRGAPRTITPPTRPQRKPPPRAALPLPPPHAPPAAAGAHPCTPCSRPLAALAAHAEAAETRAHAGAASEATAPHKVDKHGAPTAAAAQPAAGKPQPAARSEQRLPRKLGAPADTSLLHFHAAGADHMPNHATPVTPRRLDGWTVTDYIGLDASTKAKPFRSVIHKADSPNVKRGVGCTTEVRAGHRFFVRCVCANGCFVLDSGG